MIVRILGEGQFDIAEHTAEVLGDVDTRLQAAVEASEGAAFRAALAEMLGLVRETGQRVPDDYLGPSDLVLPAADSTLEEVRALLGDEGLIPG